MAERREIATVMLIALGCALTLASVNWATTDRIRQNESRALRADLIELLGDARALPETLPGLRQRPGSWQFCNGRLLGYSEAPGYGGPIRLLYTLDLRASPPILLAVRIEAHQETPGIVDFLRDPEAWLVAFEARSRLTISEVDGVTGATITTRAVTDHLQFVLTDPEAALGAAIPVSCPS